MNPFLSISNSIKKIFKRNEKSEKAVLDNIENTDKNSASNYMSTEELEKEISKLKKENEQLKNKLIYYKKRENRRRRYRARSNNNKRIQTTSDNRSNEKISIIKKDNFK